MPAATKSQDILDFWFIEISQKSWFKKNETFDVALKERFGKVVTHALAGKLDSWANKSDGCLALILLLDQFTRNIFRHSARAFSGDEIALALSLRCVDRGYIDIVEASFCHFMLMPMMHSEDLGIQEVALPLFKKHTSNKVYEFAVKHHEIITQFHRFPHRNKVLGRPNTPDENIFLTQPGSSF